MKKKTLVASTQTAVARLLQDWKDHVSQPLIEHPTEVVGEGPAYPVQDGKKTLWFRQVGVMQEGDGDFNSYSVGVQRCRKPRDASQRLALVRANGGKANRAGRK